MDYYFFIKRMCCLLFYKYISNYFYDVLWY